MIFLRGSRVVLCSEELFFSRVVCGVFVVKIDCKYVFSLWWNGWLRVVRLFSVREEKIVVCFFKVELVEKLFF